MKNTDTKNEAVLAELKLSATDRNVEVLENLAQDLCFNFSNTGKNHTQYAAACLGVSLEGLAAAMGKVIIAESKRRANENWERHQREQATV